VIQHPRSEGARRAAPGSAARLLGFAFLVFAGLCGCGQRQPNPPPVTVAPAAAPAATSPKPGEVEPGAAPLKIGFVYLGPVGEAGWTAQHDAGRRLMEKALGTKVTTVVVDRVAEGADAERAIRDLAAQGSRLIFATSAAALEPTLKVAEEFPAIAFEQAAGRRTTRNVGAYNVRYYEGWYLSGIIAGRMTKSNALGVVGAFPVPEVLQAINAFTLGARSVNPKVQTKVAWIGSWHDAGKERDAANALIDQGADVLTHHTDSTAVVVAAEERGKMAIAYHSDMSKFAPKAQLAAVTHHWGSYYRRTAERVIDGTWTPGALWGGVQEDMVRVEPISPAVPRDIVDLVRASENAMRDGTFHPFTGPLFANDGREVLTDGPMADEALNQMNYYVQGVVGKVPAAQ
jgi:simple sugar transport system substrate-binding protein